MSLDERMREVGANDCMNNGLSFHSKGSQYVRPQPKVVGRTVLIDGIFCFTLRSQEKTRRIRRGSGNSLGGRS